MAYRVAACVAVAAASWLALFAPAGAAAATIDVPVTADFSDSDGNGCALREAVRSATEDTAIGGCAAGEDGRDRVRLKPGARYTLSIDGVDNGGELGDLDVSEALTINGRGATVTAHDGLGDRVIDVRVGDARINDLTVRGGSAGSGTEGGGINVVSPATLTLSRSRILGNHASGPAARGGGISSETLLRVNDSVISGNGAPFNGGVDASGGLVMFDSAVRGNSAAFGAGGLFAGDFLTAINSEVSGNELLGETGTQAGAGLTATGDTFLQNVTIAENRADQSGGGMALYNGATARLTNVTVVDNTADLDQDNANPGDGGGIYSEGGGIYVLRNSVITRNADDTPDGDGDVEPNCSAQVQLAGNNLISNPTGCAVVKVPGTAGELPGTSAAKLGPLARNGGPTATLALAKSSPLRNEVAASKCNNGGFGELTEIIVDQRLAPRRANKRCDVGAYEYLTCQGRKLMRVGDSSANRLSGTAKGDGMLGQGGGDRLRGKGGSDGLCGGKGKDRLEGAGGADRLRGDAGKDRLVGGPGKDRLIGGPGRDVCIGGPGKDKASGCEVKIGV